MTTIGPYGTAALEYHQAGWLGVLPLPAGQKYPPPTGYTGRGAPYLSYADVYAFAEEHPDGNIALRLPDGVIGIDVDDYDNKPGAASLAELTRDCGQLPATVRSSARGFGGPGGIRFFRVPLGTYLKGAPMPGIEIIQADHRYAVVAPSINPKTGTEYQWNDQRGNTGIPKPDELPALPDAWIERLRNAHERVEATNLGNAEIEQWMAACRPGPLCSPLVGVLNKAIEQLNDGKVSRHDTGMNASRALVAFGGEGHGGARDALLTLRDVFLIVVGNDRGLDVAEEEFTRLATGAVRLAATKNPTPATACGCVSSFNPWDGVIAAVDNDGLGDGGDGGNGGEGADEAEVDRTDPRFYGATEDGMARALVDHYGNRLRYVVDGRKMWLAWDGVKWAYDEREQHREYVKELIRGLPSSEDEKEWMKFRRNCLTAAKTTAIARQAQSDQRLAVSNRELDPDPWALNTPAGIVDLKTGAIRPHNQSELHTRVTAVAPDFQADQTVWLDFLHDTFGDDEELVAYLQRLVGYSATGVVGTHILPFCHGSGGNGKGVFLETVTGVLGMGGEGYATTSPNSFLMSKQASHETEIARLNGCRMVICSEVNESDRFDEARVKQLTGGDTLTARYMHKDHFTFKPSHHLWLMGNHQPAVQSGGTSFWRRLRLVPFLQEVAEDKRVDDLQGILVRDHGPAILAWIIEGAVAYHERGLLEPTSVRTATEEYAEDQNQVKRFVSDCCVLGGLPLVRYAVPKIYAKYEEWCREQGEEPVAARVFGKKLKTEARVDTVRSNGQTFALGITLIDHADDLLGGM